MSKDPCTRTRASELSDFSDILYSDLCLATIAHTSERTVQAWRRGSGSAGIDAACRGAISATRCGHHDHDHQDGAARKGASD